MCTVMYNVCVCRQKQIRSNDETVGVGGFPSHAASCVLTIEVFPF